MFSQFFVNPAMLLGAFAITAPVAIFLLNRFRYRTIDWAALTFLERAFKQQKRRLQVENLLLLLIRCAILILLALAMARPTQRGDVVVDEDEASRNVVILLDTSYSTGYQVGSTEDETVRAQALRSAKDIVTALKDGDRVNVLAFDETVRVLYREPLQISESSKATLLSDLDEAVELDVSERGTDLGEALHALPRVLRPFDFDSGGRPPPADAPPLKKTVFLLTDATRRGFMNAKGGLEDKTLATTAEEIKKLGGALLLVDCAAEDPRNVTVTSLRTREPVVGRELPCHIELTLKNESALALRDLTVEYYVDGAKTPQKTVSLELGPESEVTPDPLRYIFRKSGTHPVEVRVKSDPLQIDNRRQLVVDVREEVRVLLVDGQPSNEDWQSETDFIYPTLALNEYGELGRGLIRPEVVDEATLASRELDPYDVVVVANVVQLPEDVVHKLERYTSGGGTIVFTMGDFIDKDAYNELLWRGGKGLLPCELLEKKGGTRAEASADESAPEWVIALGESDGHVVDMFRDKELGEWMRSAPIFGFYAVRLAPEEPVEGFAPAWVPLKLIPRGSSDDVGEAGPPTTPLLVEKPFGRGRVVAWLSTIDDHWNHIVAAADVFFVALWRELTLDLSQRARPRVNLWIGDRYERTFSAEQYAARVTVEAPGERTEGVPLEKVENRELFRLTYPVTDELSESGLYSLKRSGLAAGEDPEPEHFAVRIDPAEGSLAKYSVEELRDALALDVREVKPAAAREALVSDAGSAGNREFWREVLVLVLILLVAESVLAAAFGRRRK